ncbi:hypothetical protein EPN87_01055 [archaeon]|nr:MAG: hypothetical protein EPN87_01055 [archaeon]
MSKPAKAIVGGVGGYFIGRHGERLSTAYIDPSMATALGLGAIGAYGLSKVELAKKQNFAYLPSDFSELLNDPEVHNRYSGFRLWNFILGFPTAGDKTRFAEPYVAYSRTSLNQDPEHMIYNLKYKDALLLEMTRNPELKDNMPLDFLTYDALKAADKNARYGAIGILARMIKNNTLDPTRKIKEDYWTRRGYVTNPEAIRQKLVAEALQDIRKQIGNIEKAGEEKAKGEGSNHPRLKKAGEFAAFGAPRGLFNLLYGKEEHPGKKE